ncbi:MAG: hypothetical protein K6B41_15405 [Butyrivibrio sp.]|nr:hypothetical protein [Butyrivibrio sp.]
MNNEKDLNSKVEGLERKITELARSTYELAKIVKDTQYMVNNLAKMRLEDKNREEFVEEEKDDSGIVQFNAHKKRSI